MGIVGIHFSPSKPHDYAVATSNKVGWTWLHMPEAPMAGLAWPHLAGDPPTLSPILRSLILLFLSFFLL